MKISDEEIIIWLKNNGFFNAWMYQEFSDGTKEDILLSDILKMFFIDKIEE